MQILKCFFNLKFPSRSNAGHKQIVSLQAKSHVRKINPELMTSAQVDVSRKMEVFSICGKGTAGECRNWK